MNEFIYTLVIIFVIVMISFLLINIKFLIKGEEFKKGSCSTTGESCACSVDGEHQGECVND
jgi:hypothetical protein